MLRCRSVLVPVVVLLITSGTLLHGAWDSAPWEAPVVRRFSLRELGNRGAPQAITQDPLSGTIYAACSDGLLSYDGKSWTAVSSIFAARLDFDPAGRLWFGAFDDLGYIELQPGVAPRVVSLRDRLPFPLSEIQNTWLCYPTSTATYFVLSHKLLRWDGTQFQIWEFAGGQRLFPLILEGALWLHQPEVGLFRVDETGPRKIRGPDEVPDRGLLWLARQDSQLIGASNYGFRTLGREPESISSPELNELMWAHRVTGVFPLRNGFRAVATLHGGVAIIDSSARIVRRIPLPGNTNGGMADRDGYLWLVDGESLVRIETSGAVAQMDLGHQLTGFGIWEIVADGQGGMWLGADRQILRASASASGWKTQVVHETSSSYFSLQPAAEGLLVPRFGGVDFIRRGKVEVSFDYPGWSFVDIRPLHESGRYLAVHTTGVVELRLDSDGRWFATEQPPAAGPVGNVAIDSNDDVWISSALAPPRRLVWKNGKLGTGSVPEVLRRANRVSSLVVQRKEDMVIFVDRAAYRVVPNRDPVFIRETPGVVLSAALSEDEKKLYLSFRRPNAPTDFELGLAMLELPDDQSPHWRDLYVPDIGTVGAISNLAVSRHQGGDTLWIGGDKGLILARVSELADWTPPRPPKIELLTATPSPGGWPHDSKLRFQLRSPDVAMRPALRFQISFGRTFRAWDPPTDEIHFDYSDLVEGDYVFSARVVNAAGLASEHTTFSFTILPPWYRSPWAYAGYVTILVASVLGAIRYRERRIRARNLELEKQVAERTEELVKANAAKDDFLASMSHEIRNPMNGVVGLSAAIDISHLDEEGRYRFGLLRHCATHLASLLEDILDFSKLQSGTIELDPQPFSPAELLDAVSAITSPVSAAASVKVEFALGPSVPPRLIGDARRIRQVLLNYVSNAIKYAPQGDIDVTVWARIVGEKNAVLTFAVSDAGPGIPLEEQERIFEKFERGAGARSNRIPGTGMGLAVCRRLATKMGGNAWVESAPGEGSTFFLSLELPIAAPVTLDNATQTIVDLPKLALIVDDEDYNLVALATMLERRGFQVLRAANADAALAALAQHPDVVFLDYDMPDTTGPALAKRIRQTTQQRQPLIIATTAYSTVEKRRECLAAGMDGFLSKPIGEERLGSALAEAIQSRSPGDARHFVLPSRDSFDPLENLQTLARQHAQTLEAELAEFSTAARAEFEELHAGLTAEDRQNSARAAHKLAGRFGFLHAAAAMKRALQLERLCQQGNWTAARPLATELTQDWTSLHDTLTRLNCEPA